MRALWAASLAAFATTALGAEAGSPQVITRVPPKYPAIAYKRHLEGCVRVSYLVDDHGRTSDFKVEASVPERLFDATSVHALRQWRYQDAAPPVRVEQVLTYRLEAPGPVEVAAPFSCNKKDEVLPALLVLP